MVEATPIRLSYVIYPGEMFFDGQLVAIEENRLVFRRDMVWADGRHEKSVEIKPLRQPSDNAMQAYDVVGPICETGDTFARDRKLPPLAAGDDVAFMTAGA